MKAVTKGWENHNCNVFMMCYRGYQLMAAWWWVMITMQRLMDNRQGRGLFFVWVCYGVLGLIGLNGNNWGYWEFHLVVKFVMTTLRRWQWRFVWRWMCLDKQVFSWTSMGANFAWQQQIGSWIFRLQWVFCFVVGVVGWWRH